MSGAVGPRPFVPSESNVEGWATRRFEVRPGITAVAGLGAQRPDPQRPRAARLPSTWRRGRCGGTSRSCSRLRRRSPGHRRRRRRRPAAAEQDFQGPWGLHKRRARKRPRQPPFHCCTRSASGAEWHFRSRPGGVRSCGSFGYGGSSGRSGGGHDVDVDRRPRRPLRRHRPGSLFRQPPRGAVSRVTPAGGTTPAGRLTGSDVMAGVVGALAVLSLAYLVVTFIRRRSHSRLSLHRFAPSPGVGAGSTSNVDAPGR